MKGRGTSVSVGQIGAAVIVTNSSGQVQDQSPGALELFASGEPPEGGSVELWPLFPARFQVQLGAMASMAPSVPFVEFKMSVDHRDRPRTWLEVRAYVLLDQERKPAGVVHLCNDITWMMQEELFPNGGTVTKPETMKSLYQRQKHEALGTLTAGLAHDFNNLLTAILSHIDLVLSAPEFPSSLQRHLVIARTSGRRAAELVSRLQTYSRQAPTAKSTVKLSPIVQEVASVLKRTIDRRIVVRSELKAGEEWTTNGDASQITQVLMNLCLNARDVMGEGGTLTIGVHQVAFDGSALVEPRRAGEFIKLSVSDTGEGISADTINRLFEPYFTTKEFGKGMGLGLAISNGIAHDHGGWMEVESEVGKGSRFSAYFPRLAPSQIETRSAPAPVAETKSLEGTETILLVDDEELVRLVARAVLSFRGYHIVEAVNGEDAVAKYEATPEKFDLVLMDLHMPRMNGWDAMGKIRELNPKAKIILLSGGAMQDLPEDLKAKGAMAVLQKPFENIELVQLVRRIIDKDNGGKT